MKLRRVIVGLLFLLLGAALVIEGYVVLQIATIKQEAIVLQKELAKANGIIRSRNSKIRELQSELRKASRVEGEYAEIIALNTDISNLDGEIITRFQRVNTHLGTAVQLIGQGNEVEAQAHVNAANEIIAEINGLIAQSNNKIAEINSILTELMGGAASKEI